MSNNNGFPSMTALLGLLAVAGYQHRDKLAEWFGGNQPGQSPQGAPAGSEKILDDARASSTGGVGDFLGEGIQELIERFKQSGRGEIADSWVRSGPNQSIAAPDLEHAIGKDTMDNLVAQTGLSREEILARLSKELPDAVDRYTPDGRVAA